MKYLFPILAVTLFFVLTACANPGAGDAARVKCPACGYQFNVVQTG